MTITADTQLDQRELRPNGIIQVRLRKMVMNGDAVLSSLWYRTSFTPGCDIDAELVAVNTDLVASGYPAVSAPDVATIKTTAAAEWTPEVVDAYRDAG